MHAGIRSGSLDELSETPVVRRHARRSSCPQVTIVDENRVRIDRAPFTQVAFDELHLKPDTDGEKSIVEKLKSKCQCTNQKLFKLLSAYLPIVRVIRYYNLKENIVTDSLAGITIGILHIPQALAFGLLTSVKIENGLYTSVWPVILYVLFGTSAHVSMGTSAVICIVTASVVDRQADMFKEANPHLMNTTVNETLRWVDIPEFMDFKESTAMGITFFTGLILIAMGLLKLGFITAYMSDSFFSGFTSGAGVHIATSQIPAILGLKIPRYGGAFKIVKTYGAIFGAISNVNAAALITAIISAIIIFFVKDYVNEKFKHKLPIPIPVELFIVIFATLISYLVGMAENFGVDIINYIPNNIPPPVIPSFVGVETYLVDCFVLAILIFANTIAMAKICAKRHNCEVNDSQEMIAYGICNFGGSFFHCFPSAVAPPRSMVSSTMNTKTTINGLFSAALLILLILVMSSLFEPLPKSALAAIIVCALKGLFIQLKDCVKFWKVNKIDFVIWLFTLVSVVFLDVDYGLGIGVIVSLLTVVFQAQFAKGYRVGRTKRDRAMVEHKRYADSKETSGIRVYRFHSNLFFANAEIFRMALYRATINPRKILKFIKKQEKRNKLKEKTEKRKISKLNDSNKKYIETNMDTPEILENTSAHFEVTHVNNNKSFIDTENENEFAYKNSLGGIDFDGFQFSTFETKKEYNVYCSNISLATTITLSSTESIDPEDGQEVVTDEKIRRMRKVHHVVIDFSTVNYMDISGANVVSHIFTEYAHVNIKLFLANISYDVRQTMLHADVFETIPQENVFLDVYDAVAVAELKSVIPIPEEGIEDFTIEEAAEDKYITAI